MRRIRIAFATAVLLVVAGAVSALPGIPPFDCDGCPCCVRGH